MSKYRKAIAAACGVAATLVANGALHGNAEAIVSGLLAVATVAGVYSVPNVPNVPAAGGHEL